MRANSGNVTKGGFWAIGRHTFNGTRSQFNDLLDFLGLTNFKA